MRQEPLLYDMHGWFLDERETIWHSSGVLKPIKYSSSCDGFDRFLDDGRIVLRSPTVSSRQLFLASPSRRLHPLISLFDACDVASFPLTQFLIQ
ncbi:hypothetical protein SAMN05216337_1010140 [Bradyrhizobium brasilense]|uniref:Uncharacterized protein n=1 Tax=Bradyrhizobium brasilense TaxID=1419277 RepID=A0A1G6U6G4_9BRAD|nr:hypothetical protein SAMN05216337_1010140 [Bradyrhizobium brasilense]